MVIILIPNLLPTTEFAHCRQYSLVRSENDLHLRSFCVKMNDSLSKSFGKSKKIAKLFNKLHKIIKIY